MNLSQNIIKLPSCWLNHLNDEFNKTYMKELKNFIIEEKKSGKTIYPKGDEIFAAFNATPFDKVKVVIIGQDPYHGPNQAHGLCFSVNKGIIPPPSLKNIYIELKEDMGIVQPKHGNLTAWANQGVLLLNSVLTVEANKPASHHGKGWEQFTDKVISILNTEKKNLVFILWGSPAQKKAQIVDGLKHKIIKSVHPSPLSAYRGFFGSRPFSQTNEYLKKCKISPIDWNIK